MAESGTGGAPANYNGGQRISVYPTAVYDATFYRNGAAGLPSSIAPAATDDTGGAMGSVPAMLQSISNSFKTIFDTWDGLKLSWVGDAADAADTLKTQLDDIQDRLYGKDDQPGVIGQMCSVAASAAVNYSNTEETNTKMFDDMNTSWDYQPLPPEDADGGSGGGGGAPSDENWNYGPVSEKFS